MSASKKAPLVLVVDDFDDNRAMYVEYLLFHGFRVAEAVNGEEAVERTLELQPTVVVMDLSLPVMDGWEATRRLKANAKTRDIVVIALTGHAEPAHAMKSCLPEQLVAKVREHVARLTGEPSKSATGKNKKFQKGKA